MADSLEHTNNRGKTNHALTFAPRVLGRDSSASLKSPEWCFPPPPVSAPAPAPPPLSDPIAVAPAVLDRTPLIPLAPAMPMAAEAVEAEGASAPVWSSVSIWRPSSSIWNEQELPRGRVSTCSRKERGRSLRVQHLELSTGRSSFLCLHETRGGTTKRVSSNTNLKFLLRVRLEGCIGFVRSGSMSINKQEATVG